MIIKNIIFVKINYMVIYFLILDRFCNSIIIKIVILKYEIGPVLKSNYDFYYTLLIVSLLGIFVKNYFKY